MCPLQGTTPGARTMHAAVRDPEGQALLLGSLTVAYWVGASVVVLVHLLTFGDPGKESLRWVPYCTLLAAVLPTLALTLRWRARLPDFRDHPLPEAASLLAKAAVSVQLPPRSTLPTPRTPPIARACSLAGVTGLAVWAKGTPFGRARPGWAHTGGAFKQPSPLMTTWY